jgi:hypothetical protein
MTLKTEILDPSLEGYISHPAYDRVKKSSPPGPPASLCLPLSLLDLRPGGTGSFSDADWANPTIIDQATWIWATNYVTPPLTISPNHIPTEYTATLDGSNNITGISITQAMPYVILRPESCLEYAVVNTDYMMAIDAGIDITDPDSHAAIAATVKSEVILMSVVSSVMP